jgi:hypothetical protein
MKILIICSRTFYQKVPQIKEVLEKQGHIVELPNSYDDPDAEQKSYNLGGNEHSKFKKKMYDISQEKIKNVDAILTLNFNKNGKENYIGGATFLELYEAFMNNKKIYLYNDVPNGILYDEIIGFNPIIINGNLQLIHNS